MIQLLLRTNRIVGQLLQQINALYKDFVLQKELSAEQKYFPSSFIPFYKTSNATSSIPASMPSESPLIIQLDKMKNCFQTLSELIQKNCKRASIFYTSPEEIQLNDFCQDQVKPIVNELQFNFEFFRKLFQRDIKEMKEVFESTKGELYEIKKQNEFLKDQLVEASLKHEVEISVLINHECEDNFLHAELEQVKKNSIEIQEGLQAKIKILEKDVQRCQKQSVDFDLKLQHVKEKHKWESTLSNKNTNPLDFSWISKMEKLENENVSLDFQVQSLMKERENNLLSTISELKTRLKTVEKGMNAASSVRRPMNRDSHVKNSVLANSKNSAKKVAVYVRKNKQTDNTSANVISNKENVNDVNVANAAKAKTLLRVSCMQNVLIPCHDNCLAKYKLNVHSNDRRDLSTNSRTPTSTDTTYIVLKTKFSKKLTQSKSLDTIFVVSKPKIDVGRTSNAEHKVVQIVLWIIDSGCSKHMTGLGHNLFSVGQFCDGDLEVAFRSKTCYVRNLEGDDLLTGGREYNLYTISIFDMAASSPIFLMSKTTSAKSWLWHRRLSHLNFGTINDLTRLNLVGGLPKFKYEKDHLRSACEREKSKKASHSPKLVVQIVLWIVDSGCSKHMTGDRSLLRNFIEKFMGTVLDIISLAMGYFVNGFKDFEVAFLFQGQLDLVDGLPKFKYEKDHLYSACEREKSKKASHPPKLVPSDHSKLELLHMDLCGPMMVALINGKKYILVIVDDFSRYTWVYFLHLKDETPEIIKKFIAQA
ncbi:integrase, catalytic region, zinc finger, CCHC-type containing protein [Tanacetum coccineum]